MAPTTRRIGAASKRQPPRLCVMTQALSLASPQWPAALPETPAEPLRLATCPLCHTSEASLTPQMLQAGGGWRCGRCGQRWDARRLETVAAYAAWVAEQERRERRSDNAARQGATPLPGRAGRNDPTPTGDAISTWDDEGGRPESTGEKACASRGEFDLALACRGPRVRCGRHCFRALARAAAGDRAEHPYAGTNSPVMLASPDQEVPRLEDSFVPRESST
jgi:hypothetical protein